jgi:hypothetical protein
VNCQLAQLWSENSRFKFEACQNAYRYLTKPFTPTSTASRPMTSVEGKRCHQQCFRSLPEKCPHTCGISLECCAGHKVCKTIRLQRSTMRTAKCDCMTLLMLPLLDDLASDLVTQETNWYKPAPGESYRPLLAMPSQTRALDPLVDNPKTKLSIDPPPAQQQPKASIQSPRNDPESQGIGLDGLGHYSGNTNDPGGASVHSARQGVPKSANNHPNIDGSGKSGSSTPSDNTKYPGS